MAPHDHGTGASDAFACLVARHGRYVYHLCYRMLGSHWDAEDASQEAFLRAHVGLKKRWARPATRAWLTRIAVNVCLNWRRSSRHWSAEPLDAGNVAAPDAEMPRVELTELQMRVQEAVQELPAKRRTALILRFYERLSFEEIGEMMGTTAESARMNAMLARKALREKLKPWLSDEV